MIATLKAAWLAAAVMTSAQGPAGPPEAWKQKFDAAAEAEKAGKAATAEALLTEVVGEAEELGRADLRLADPLERLARFYMNKAQKRYAEAEALLRRALAIREEAQGAEHEDVADALIQVATCQVSAQKKPPDAVGPMLWRALAIYEKSKGKDDPEVARVLHCMATYHMLRREFGEAETALTRAVAIREKAFGPESAKVADLLDDLGDLHFMQAGPLGIHIRADGGVDWVAKRHDTQAEASYSRALAIREKALKPDDPDIAESLYSLGHFAIMGGRPAEGERYLGRWLAMQERAKAPASEDQAAVLMRLAGASRERKDWAEAERRLARTQAIVAEAKGGESDEVATVLTERAAVALDAGRPDDTERFLKQGLELQAARIGPENPDVTEARALMAGRHEDHSQDRKGQTLWPRLNALAERTRREHDALADILTGYADLLRRTNRVVPRPSAGDLAYLKNAGARIFQEDPDSLAAIESLSMSPDALDDEGLSHLASIEALERLSLSVKPPRGGDAITAAGVAHLKGLTRLRALALEGDGITDAVLARFAGLEGLEELDLTFTGVTDAGFEHLKGLDHLRRLRVYVTWPRGKHETSDAGLAHLKGLGHLRALALEGAGISDAGLAQLAGLADLEELDLAFTGVTDAGLEHLKGLDRLRVLDVQYTKVTPAAVDRLRRARPGLAIVDRPKEPVDEAVGKAGFFPFDLGPLRMIEIPNDEDPTSERGQAIERFNATVRAHNAYDAHRERKGKQAKSRPGEPAPPDLPPPPPLPPLP